MKNTDYVLFLDLDGVLVDYNSGWWAVTNQLGIRKQRDKDLSREEYKRIGRQIRNISFWASLGWEQGGQALWQSANELFENVHILTSTAAREENDYHKIVAQGKMEWIDEHLSGLSQDHVHIVTEGKLKAKFASKTSILVDDRKSTIAAFSQAGGFGILHSAKHYKKTIDELIEIASPINLGEIAKSLPLVSRGFWNGK